MESLLREIPLYFRLLKVCKCKQTTDTKGVLFRKMPHFKHPQIPEGTLKF